MPKPLPARNTGTITTTASNPILAPGEFAPAAIRLQHTIGELPWLGRLHRNAFRSGAGPGLPRWKQLGCRPGYYALAALVRTPQLGRLQLPVRGQLRTLAFDCRNRQFIAVYFQKYAAGFEPAVSATILSLLPRHGVFYDIGSNWGWFSLLVAQRSEFTGHVHAFEPWPSSYADLTSLLNQAELTGWVTAHPVALGAADTTVAMQSGRHSGHAKVVAAAVGTRVPQRHLDSLGLEPPALMKIDAEGSEAVILRGGEQVIRTAQPFVVFEDSYHGTPASLEVIRLLESWNYRLFIPALSAGAGRPEPALFMDGSGLDRTPCRLVLHPVSSRSRGLHPGYLNLLACPASRLAQVEPLVERD